MQQSQSLSGPKWHLLRFFRINKIGRIFVGGVCVVDTPYSG